MLTKICTDFEASKTLKELGIEAETSFCWEVLGKAKPPHLYHWEDDEIDIEPFMTGNLNIEKHSSLIKAYSLEQIWQMLPRIIIVKKQKRMLGMGKEMIYYKNRLGYPVEPFIYDRSFSKKTNTWSENSATLSARLLIKLKQDKII